MDDRSAEAVISRDGKESAVFFNDAAGWSDGKPRNVDLWVYSNAAMPADFSAGWPDPAASCKFPLDASKLSDIHNLSPSLSPDGSKVLWGDSEGVKLMSLGDVAGGCAGAGSPVTLVPGGSQPFYAKGNVQPGAANPRQPDPTPPAGGATPSGGGTPTTTSTGAVVLHLLARFSFKPKQPHAHKKVTFDARKSKETGGHIVSYRWKFGDGTKAKGRKVKHAFKRRGRYTVALTVRDDAGHKATVKHKVKVVR
jgi:chitodextrinase